MMNIPTLRTEFSHNTLNLHGIYIHIYIYIYIYIMIAAHCGEHIEMWFKWFALLWTYTDEFKCPEYKTDCFVIRLHKR